MEQQKHLQTQSAEQAQTEQQKEPQTLKGERNQTHKELVEPNDTKDNLFVHDIRDGNNYKS